MLGSSYFDPVLGIDIHWEMVPMPAPVPTPIPNPFTGMVFDPMGLAVGLAIGGAMSLVTGAKFKGPVIYWGFAPANNTGTNAKHIPGHILIPPGTLWAPVPRTPKPTVHPGETPKPAAPIKPENDGVMITGSKTVHVGGTNAVRLGDMVMSCSEPVRLPSSVVLAVPKGAPILIGGPMTLDLMAAIMASLRTRFIGDSLQALISRMQPSRFRTLLSRLACFLTGHPVDVASGKVLTDAIDADLPGPMPLRIERSYLSSLSARAGVLGHGWSHSLDRHIWEERGKVVHLAEDGREIEFDTFDFPEHRMGPGHEVWHPLERQMLRCEGDGRWTLTASDGVRSHFAPVPGRRDGRSSVTRIVSACGSHEITFDYDRRGCLAWVRDSGGRVIGFEHDDQGRLVTLKLPWPHERGWYTHRKYRYDEDGDLVEVTDSLGASWSFEYQRHLLVRETDRTGLGFYFEYDGLGEDAWCTRTWGDGGIFDHVLRYDKKGHVTYVTNSRGHTTQYHMNAVGIVERIVDPLGGEQQFTYDPRTLQCVRETAATGRTTSMTYDRWGRAVEFAPSGVPPTRVTYDDAHFLSSPTSRTGSNGATWQWRYDASGHVAEVQAPTGESTVYEREKGLLTRIVAGYGATATFTHDAQKNTIRARLPDGTENHFVYDLQGRLVERRVANGASVHIVRDTEDRILEVRTPFRTLRSRYDAEGNVVERSDEVRHLYFRYGHFHRLTGRSDGQTAMAFEYDSEGELSAIVNEAGERAAFLLDEAGRLVAETGFDGSTRRIVRDKGGRVTTEIAPSGRRTEFTYDTADRRTEIQYPDGTFLRVAYGADGEMEGIDNGTADVRIVRDPLGRVVRETADGGVTWVASQYGPDGRRSSVESSLGARQAVSRDVMGRALRVRQGRVADARAHEIAFERDVSGQEVARALPGGIRVAWAHDAAGRPIERTILRGEGGAQTVLRGRTYHYRASDQLEAIVDSAWGASLFAYDGRGRVTGEQQHGVTIDRAVDLVGNIHRRADRSDRRYGPGGRLLEADGTVYRYDTDGRRIARIDPDGAEWGYAWNGAGMLSEVVRPDGRRVRFAYDALARRTGKKLVQPGPDGSEVVESETRFVWDGNALMHEISNTQGLTTWYWEPDSSSPIAKERGEHHWAIAPDHVGTPSQMFDEWGELAWDMQLDVYGVARVDRAAEACPWRWPGQYADEETGDAYNRFRYYDARAGLYLSPDPLGLRAGTRAYGYVPDPNLLIDPLGLFGSVGQVGYWTNDFQNELNQMHTPRSVPTSPLSNGPMTNIGQNVAVVELKNGDRIPFHSEGNPLHSEIGLIDAMEHAGIPPSEVSRIYTELSPCEGCLPALREWLGPEEANVRLEFSWFHRTIPNGDRIRLKAERRESACTR